MATTDAIVAFDATKSIVEHQTLALSGNLLGLESMRGPDGRYYSPFGIGQSLYNIPFYVAGRAVQRHAGLRVGGPDTVSKAAVALGGAFAAALTVWATFLLASTLYGRRRSGCVAAGLLGLATALWPYSKFGFNQPLAALWLTLMALCLTRAVADARRGARVAAWAGACAGAALLTRHEMAIVVPAVVAYLLAAGRHSEQSGRRGWLVAAFGATFLAALGTWAALNWIRFGNPLDSGLMRDPTPGFGSSPWTGLVGLLLSPGASFFLYSPAMLLVLPALARLWRTDRSTAWLLGAPALSLLLVYAQLGNWVGGRSYGGRYLVAVLPLCCAALPPWIDGVRAGVARASVGAVCALSVLFQVPGVAIDFAKAGFAWAHQYSAGELPDRRYVWTASPLVVNTRALAVAVPANIRYLARIEEPPVVPVTARDGDRDFSQRYAFSLDFWWLYAYYMRVLPGWLALAAGAALAALSVALAAAAWRHAARDLIPANVSS